MSRYSEFVDKSLPIEKRIKVNKCVIGYYLVRPVCNIVSMPLVKTDINPTLVTMLSSVFVIIAYFSYILIPGSVGFWIGWFSIYIWNVLDGVDGIIARYNNKCSKIGELWDAATGWLAVTVFYTGMGHLAYSNPGYMIFGLQFNSIVFLVLGYLTAICWLFPRLIMQKKNVLMGDGAVKDIKAREDYGIFKLIIFNITSINGLASVLLLVAHIFKIMGLCMVCYFILSIVIALGSLYSMLKTK